MTRRDDEPSVGPRAPDRVLESLGLSDASPDEIRAVRDQLTAHLDAVEGVSAGVKGADVTDVLIDDDGADLPHPTPSARGTGGPSHLRPVLAVLVGVGVVLGIYFMGGVPGDTAADTAPAPAASGPGQAQVDALEAAVAADPGDVESMRELGALHHQAGDFEAAAEWQQRIVELDPRDVDARLSLGVALFGLGDLEGAEEHWGVAADLAPELAEVHYNLGFLYLSMDPPQADRAEEAWARVIEIDPDSPLAETAAAHLDRLAGEED
ncbi:MAG: tetratricopeptide repeat protein [Actinobacteria bacterium]|nr:tetratricopeptide repeat protein [Actinomycetota bacterium]